MSVHQALQTTDSRLMLVPCDNDSFMCNSFVCNMSHTNKYYVGNPYSGGLHHYSVYCEDCIKHLLANVPANLSPSAAKIEARIRAELTDEYNQVLTQKLTNATAAIRADAEKFIAFKLVESETVVTATVETESVPVEQEKTIFRCLDCGEDFESQDAWNTHKKSHIMGQEPSKNKGGRPKKVQEQ